MSREREVTTGQGSGRNVTLLALNMEKGVNTQTTECGQPLGAAWLPRWLWQQRNCLQCRKPKLNPWVRNIFWRRKCSISHCSIVAWEIPQIAEPAGYNPWGPKETDVTFLSNTFIFWKLRKARKRIFPRVCRQECSLWILAQRGPCQTSAEL